MTILRLVFSQRSANKPVRTPLRNLCENPLRTFARNNPFLCEKNLREPIPFLREPWRKSFASTLRIFARNNSLLCEPLREPIPFLREPCETPLRTFASTLRIFARNNSLLYDSLQNTIPTFARKFLLSKTIYEINSLKFQ